MPLDEDEIKKLIFSSSSIQRKALIACMYETRTREFLNLQNTDIDIDSRGVVFILRGKTVERRVLIVSFVNYLEQWLEVHPSRSRDVFPLWVSEATNYKTHPLSLGGLGKVVMLRILFFVVMLRYNPPIYWGESPAIHIVDNTSLRKILKATSRHTII